MKSRLDRYENNEQFSRVQKNQSLYDDIYSDTNYSNMVVIDDSNEIDISKIKEIIDKENNSKNRIEKDKFNKVEYDSIVPSHVEEKKLYDINEVLKLAKSQRDIIEEANEKRKIQNYKFKENLDEELTKTRQVYENLIKEEKELLNIMNTLTNVSSNDLALDMFETLVKDKDKEQTNPEDTEIKIQQIEDDTQEYSTDTFMFNTKDFEDIENIKNNVKGTSKFIKLLIFILFGAMFFVVCFMIYLFLIK